MDKSPCFGQRAETAKLPERCPLSRPDRITGAMGLEIALYSENSYLDTLRQLIKVILPVKRPYDMFTDYLLDLLGEKLRQDPDKQSCKGNK